MAMVRRYPLVTFSRLLASTPNLKPSFIIHPRVRTPEPEKQLLALTNSQQLSKPPRKFLEYSQNLDITPWKKLIEKAIIYERNYTTHKNITPRDYPFGLLQNIIKIILSQAPCYPQLADLFFVGECHTTSTWQVLGEWIGVRGKVGTLVKSKQKSYLFFDKELPMTTHFEIDEPFANLNSWKVNLSRNVAMDTISLPPSIYPYIHSHLLVDNLAVPENQLIQRCALIMHGLLLDQAKREYGSDIVHLEVLPEPQCAQGIVTNGKRFSFVWYQLNTACANNTSDKIKNYVVIEKPGLMYSKIERIRSGQDHRARRVQDFNESILRTLLAMFLWQQ